jgi:hypothetical protein
MAITRATGKAYRLGLSWIVTLAGYSPTPYEEMDGIVVDEKPSKPTTPKKEFKPNPPPVEHDPEIFEDKPENKRLIMEHFARVGLDTTNKEAMISVYQMMINKPLDVAEKTLADFCRELEASNG